MPHCYVKHQKKKHFLPTNGKEAWARFSSATKYCAVSPKVPVRKLNQSINYAGRYRYNGQPEEPLKTSQSKLFHPNPIASKTA